MSPEVARRMKELGGIGLRLATHLREDDIKQTNLSGEAWMRYVERLEGSGARLRAAAVSMLLSDYPIQVSLKGPELLSLIDFSTFVSEQEAKRKREGFDEGFELYKDGKDQLPLKVNPGAVNKVNVYFSTVMLGLKKKDRRYYLHVLTNGYLLNGLYNDSASAVLMYACLTRDIIPDSFKLACYMAANPSEAKALSTVIKSLGCNSTRVGACLAEMNALQGRDVGVVTFDEEARYRCDQEAVKEKNIKVDAHKLREAVKYVVRNELAGRTVKFDSLDEHWDKRWLWCVNGAHSGALVKREAKWATSFTKRMHRKVFAENISYEPVSRWSGVSYFTMSLKLELGKTRAIFGGDTVSYFAFDHLLSPIERAWGGRRVILNPGKGGTVGVVDRVRKMKRSGAWSVMLDYDDFNSQHTLLAQAIVIDALVKESGYDPALGAKLVSSIFEQHIVEGDEVLRLLGTLMSGHRATTIINSILNYAYLLVANEDIKNMDSVHVGDDILVMADNAAQAFRLLDSVRSSGVRMNPLKQSVGVKTSEFLRVAVGPVEAWGYLARSIGSIVSGNWVGETALDPREALSSIVASAWTLGNRARAEVGYLLKYDLNRVTGIKVDLCERMLDGHVSLNGSPVRGNKNLVEVVRVVSNEEHKEQGEDIVDVVKRYGGKKYATTDYLSNHVTYVERLALQLVGGDVTEMMVRSSYSKTLISRDIISSEKLELTTQHIRLRATQSVGFDSLVSLEKEKPGSLAAYPLIGLVRDRLSEAQIVRLLRVIGDNRPGEVYEKAFGAKEKAVICISGSVPYSDAIMYGRRAEGKNIFVNYNINF
ncbi:RNA dependent RNA polymerase [Diatom colony associated dsRNA virus 11]|uniref:RNA dependent RNA polymerase n=1 Tax=Diatom colony associated dsRNA virus 11 TaxID=1678171 RepID=UPI0007A6536B|nr:RNA dependent RNA polymerase [Diatom colony associated dsRNA virus 11]BAU79506.1 RNA dependent RNA polymerase [Diatom colony associated dsRNA virus 11]